jgi:predicted AAA+ superfamily ATPase
MIPRQSYLDQLADKLTNFPVVAMLDPRRVGKTTLSRQLAANWQGPVRHFDLEDPDDQVEKD